MSDLPSTYLVLFSNIGTPTAGSGLRLRRDLEGGTLEVVVKRGNTETVVTSATLTDGRRPGAQHLMGQWRDGAKVDVTLHQNHQGKSFMYGTTSYRPDRGGTGTWIAEEEEGT